MFLSIVIPAYNEEGRISKTLDKYLRFYHTTDVEFVVVLNDCTDNTLSIVESFSKKYPNRVRYINIKEPILKGGAIRKGFGLAQGDLISFLDADGSTSPEEFDKVVRKVADFDGAIASRWKKGSKIVGGSFFREVISIGFMALVKMLFWMPFIDTQCGAKVFKRKVVQEVLPELRINNMAFDVELLHKILRKGFTIVEVPSIWIDHSDSSTTLGSPWKLFLASFNMFATILKIRLGK